MPRGRGGVDPGADRQTRSPGRPRLLLSTTTLTAFFALPSYAAWPAPAIGNVGADAVVQLAALVGVLSFGVFSAIALVRSRNATETENARLRADAAALKADADRASA